MQSEVFAAATCDLRPQEEGNKWAIFLFFPLRISIATISLSRKTEKEKKGKSSGEDPALKKVFVGKQSFILFAFSKFAKIGFFIWKIITFSLGVVPSLLPSLLDFLMLGSDFTVGKLTGKGKSVWLVGI